MVGLGKDTKVINGSLNTGELLLAHRISCSCLLNSSPRSSHCILPSIVGRQHRESLCCAWLAVFNIVVRSPDLAAFRRMVFERYVIAGGDGSRFSPVNIFAPHITVVRCHVDAFHCSRRCMTDWHVRYQTQPALQSQLHLGALACMQGFTASNSAFNATDLFLEDGIFKWDNSLHAGAQTCAVKPAAEALVRQVIPGSRACCAHKSDSRAMTAHMHALRRGQPPLARSRPRDAGTGLATCIS